MQEQLSTEQIVSGASELILNGEHERAIRLLTPLAEQGVTDAQCVLGWAFRHGQGVEKDHLQSWKWYEMAAAGGNAKAQYALAVRYIEGDGVEKDGKKAAEMMQLSADQGDCRAEFNIAASRLDRLSTPADPADAKAVLEMFESSAAHGSGDAAALLGDIYDDGHYVDRDAAKACYWYQQAVMQGVGRSMARLEELKEELGDKSPVDLPTCTFTQGP